MQEFLSFSENETMLIAEKICRNIRGGTVVAFSGGMGMGKTAFVRGALKAYGNESFVSSPTFSLVHDYEGSPHIYHFDMYRVTSFDDLYSTGFFDYIDGEAVLFIEWSENISGALPENTVYIEISQGELPDSRKITVNGGGF